MTSRFNNMGGDTLKQIVIKIKGKPKAQQRHRHTKKGLTYDPSVNDKRDFLALIHSQAPKVPFKQAISIYIRFSMPYVKKHYRTGKFSNELKPNPPISYTNKPDIDNLLKFIFDSGNNVLWMDDSQIYRVQMEKIYSESPGTTITIVEDGND